MIHLLTCRIGHWVGFICSSTKKNPECKREITLGDHRIKINPGLQSEGSERKQFHCHFADLPNKCLGRKGSLTCRHCGPQGAAASLLSRQRKALLKLFSRPELQTTELCQERTCVEDGSGKGGGRCGATAVIHPTPPQQGLPRNFGENTTIV